MKRFIEYSTSTDITYNEWLDVLTTIENDILNEGIFDKLKLPAAALRIVKTFKEELIKLKSVLKVDLKDLLSAFKEPHVFKILKVAKFSIKTLYNLYMNAYIVIREGIFKTFEEINKSGILKKIRKGTVKVDELLNKYPIIKKLSGPVIAGLLLYMWLNMSFISDLEYDMDISLMFSALKGSFSIEDLFGSDKGTMLIALFGVGFSTGLSAPWLGKTAYNLALALIYTGMKHTNIGQSTIKKFKGLLNK